MFRLHTNSMCTVHLCPSPTAVQSDCGARDPGAPPHIFDAIERHIAARADDGGAMDVGEDTHLAEAETNREIRTLPFLQRAIPMAVVRSEEHTSELQSLMRISYAVFSLKKKKSQ